MARPPVLRTRTVPAGTVAPAEAPPRTEDLLRRCTFPPAGTPLVCAVSGGADSLALLALAVAAGCRATAAHVDHGLRAGSAAEADVVEAAARRLGAGFAAHRVAVTPGANLEARARDARRSVLPPGTATGHTADDQAETIIVNFLRGAGLDGLAGMRPGPAKPILALRRHETRALCGQLGLVPLDDPTNRDPAFVRNRIRHEVIPLLDEVAGRDVAGLLARQAHLLRDEATLLDALAAGIDPTESRAVAGAPIPLARRAVRRWLAAGVDHPPAAADVERVLAVAAGEAVACEIAGGRRVRRTAGRLVLDP
jgi:tRNA(Ile)-lysidine synthase